MHNSCETGQFSCRRHQLYGRQALWPILRRTGLLPEHYNYFENCLTDIGQTNTTMTTSWRKIYSKSCTGYWWCLLDSYYARVYIYQGGRHDRGGYFTPVNGAAVVVRTPINETQKYSFQSQEISSSKIVSSIPMDCVRKYFPVSRDRAVSQATAELT